MLHTVAVFYNLHEAQLFQAFLKSNHITCFLADEHIVSINPLYTSAVGGIKVNVGAHDLQTALALYETYKTGESPYILPETCPRCHSSNILMLPEEKAAYYDEFRCFDCDYEWDDRQLHNINPGHLE